MIGSQRILLKTDQFIKVKSHEKRDKNRMVLILAVVGFGGIGEILFKVQTYTRGKSWRSNKQHNNDRGKALYCKLKVTKRLDLNCSHHKINK